MQAESECLSGVSDPLAATRAASLLDDFATQPAVPENLSAEAKHLAEQVNLRQYLLRFPDRLLRWFRRLALVGALPLTYVLALILSQAFIVTFMVAEGELLLAIYGWNAGTALGDAIFLATVAILPVLLILWFYRLVYTLYGVAIVYFLGLRLSPSNENSRVSSLVTTEV